MLKRYLPLLFIISLLNYVSANEYEPHPEPIVSIKPPKPNIMMILDNSSSMTNSGGFDMDPPEGYDPNVLGNLEIHKYRGGKISRAASMQWTVLGLMKKYRNQANIGMAPLDNTNDDRYFNKLFTIPMSIEKEADFAYLRDKILLDFTFLGKTPLLSPTYRTSVKLRGKRRINNQIKSSIQYRCQEQHLILMTDGEPNEHHVDGTILDEDKKLVSFKGTTLNGLGKRFGQLDMVNDSINKQPDNDKDLADQEWNSKGYRKMPLYAHAVRFTQDASKADAELKQFVSHSGKGVFVAADNTKELEIGFHKIFQNIIESRSGTGSFEDQLGESRTEDTIRYSSFYDPTSWLGEIKALKYNKSTKQFSDQVWSTHDKIKPSQGQFISYNGSLDNLNGLTKNDVNWLKGNHVDDLRIRSTPLADIIDSHISYSAKDQLNINLNTLGPNLRDHFLDYLIKKNRDKRHYSYIIAGSNDGLLNFIYAEKGSDNKGGERHTSYFPSFFVDDIDEITNPFYEHNFKVNGTTTLFDAIIDGSFKTIGITSMGAGKEALVGYQIYGSGSKTEIKPTFEITRKGKFKDLGYTYSDVEFLNIQQNNESKAIAIFGNGYTLHHKDNQKSVVYIIDAFTGEKYKSIELPNGRGGASSISTIVSTDKDGYQQLDRLYVGDQSGKLFRVIFDQKKSNPLNSPIVTLLFDAGSDHPITVKPTLKQDRSGNIWVYFGTGRAILKSDIGPESYITHNVYGIKDSGKEIYKNQLSRQEIFKIPEDSNGDPLIDITDNPAKPDGWYIPLKLLGETEETGERIILPASLYRDEFVVFTTYGVHLDENQRNDPCLGGGIHGKVFFVDLYSGRGSHIIKDGQGSGIISEDSRFGVPTGPGMHGGNSLSGNYNGGNDYSRIEKELIADNSESSHSNGSDDHDSCSPSITGSDGSIKEIPISCPQKTKQEPQRIYIKHL